MAQSTDVQHDEKCCQVLNGYLQEFERFIWIHGDSKYVHIEAHVHIAMPSHMQGGSI